jgi:hypothetical protein
MFIDNIDTLEEIERVKDAKELGYDYQPKEAPSMSVFSSTEPEYLIYGNEHLDIPPQLVEDMNTIIEYYIENEERLQVTYHNNKLLQAAHREWKIAHPPVERETVINFWKIK